jgi:quinol monooxygenase YgiN
MRGKPENAAAYEKLMSYVAEMTLRNEPGVPYYAFSKSVSEPDTYVVIEVYQDAQVHAAHMASAWVRNSIPVTRALIEGKFDIRQYVTPGQEPVKLQHG